MGFGNKLSLARKKSGYSLESLSRTSRIEISRLVSYEEDRVMPRHRTLKRLSAYLHVSWYYFLKDSCYTPWLGRCSQSYADIIWDQYGKKDAMIFQDICVQAEIIPEMKQVNPQYRKELYRSFFHSYCELKENRRHKRRDVAYENTAYKGICDR